MTLPFRSRRSSRQILAANLQALQRVTHSGGHKAIAIKCGVGEGTIARAMDASGNLTLANLEAIARAYGMEPWQLIQPQGVSKARRK